MTHPALIERITRSLAYMLRHQPEEFDLELDSGGYGKLEEVVRALSERLGEDVEVEDVESAIASGDRPRYEIVDNKVRALYGHSIDVEPGEATKPPQMLYVGINSRDAKRAVQYGLRGGRRRFLHLALTTDDARETGRRTGREYSVLSVHALDAWEDGVNFYDRTALFLAEQIPTEFLELVENRDDGVEQQHRGNGRERSRGERGGGDRGRGRGGRGRDRGRSRGEREERPAARRDDDRAQPQREPVSDRPTERRPEREERRPQREERRPEPAAAKPAQPAPARRAPSGSAFGSGVVEEPEAVKPKRAPEPRPAPAPRKAAPAETTREDSSGGSSGFGAGI